MPTTLDTGFPGHLLEDENDVTQTEEETHICKNCCAQFTNLAELICHKSSCVDSQVVIICDGQGGHSSTDSTPDSSPAMDADEGSACTVDLEENSNTSLLEPDSSDKAECLDKKPNISHKASSMGDIVSPKMGVSATSWGPSQNGDPRMMGQCNFHDGLQSPKIAVAPPSQEAKPAGSGHGFLSIPMILEELRVLQQRQIHQMQMTEQICRQVLMLGSPAQPSGQSSVPSSSNTGLTARPFSTLSPVLSSQLTQTTTATKTYVTAEGPKQAIFSMYNTTSPPFVHGNLTANTQVPIPENSSPVCGKVAAPAFPMPASAINLKTLSQLVPQQPVTGSPPFLNTQGNLMLNSRILETMPGLLRPKNNESSFVEALQLSGVSVSDKPTVRHKCRFCAKVFGSDSALQIHLRSHTGERPYKCNICGNRFTTRGNLKVHFHRHKEKYPHIQMNPHPVPEHLDNVPTSSGIPYGMSVPPEKAEENLMDKKPALPPLAATLGLGLLSTAQGLPIFSKPPPVKNPADASLILPLQKTFNGNIHSKLDGAVFNSKADENTPPGHRNALIGMPSEANGTQLNKLMTSLPGLTVLANQFKATLIPFTYFTDPASSETSKLQQLVEKIDKPVTNTNQCVICLRVLSCPRALRLHYSTHTGERPFKCKICGRAFSTKGNLKAHYFAHKSKPSMKSQNSCPICQKKFSNAVLLQQHIRMHLGGQIPNVMLLDNTPPEQPIEADSFSVEDRSMEEQEFSDDAMDENTADEDSLEGSIVESEKAEHQQSESSNQDEEEEEEDSTTISAMPGPEEERPAEKDLQQNDASQSCNGQGQSLGDPVFLKQTTAPLSGNVSPATSQLDSTRDATMEDNHGDATMEDNHGPSQKEKTEVKQEDSSLLTKQDPLREKTSTKDEFHPEGSQTVTPQKAVDPISISHSDMCSISFPCQSSLDTHYKELAKDGLSFCSSCGQGFLENSSLQAHMLIHEKDKISPKPLEIPNVFSTIQDSTAPNQCSPNTGHKTDKSEFDASLGVTSLCTEPVSPVPHAGSGVCPALTPPSRRTPKQHICHACKKSFSSSSALQIHERIHTGEKPFGCSICGRAFTTRGNLKVHMSTHVWNNSPTKRGRRLSLDGTASSQTGDQIKFQDFLPKDVPAQLAAVSPLSFWNQYAAFLSNRLVPKPVSPAILLPHAFLGAGNVGSTAIGGMNNVKEKLIPEPIGTVDNMMQEDK
ncbi:sal-like protein 2 [Protopterus annectens]|uniref:sal-like protein 2 n=1 Tax=Protopterus annectens TaxID=7888 RepID=UPI001CFB600D|nr:sal-like protein 2 [Protopterus annectens]